jgi:hypothetical protein
MVEQLVSHSSSKLPSVTVFGVKKDERQELARA